MIKRSSLEALQKALEIDPESLPANVFLALNYQRQNQYEEALHYLNKAASLDTHNSAIQVELGNTYALSGDLASAIYAYRRAVTQSPNTPIFLKMLLQFQINYRYKLEDWDLNAVREVMSKYPNDVILIDLLGQLLSQIEEEAMAEDYFKQVLELDSSYAPVYLHLGELYLQIGKIQKAQEYLSKANEIAPASNASEQAQYLMQIYLP